MEMDCAVVHVIILMTMIVTDAYLIFNVMIIMIAQMIHVLAEPVSILG
jgi:hypothetical protein